MTGIRNLDDDRFYHRQVESGRDPVIEIARIIEVAIVTVEVLLVERSFYAMDRATLHLVFYTIDAIVVDGWGADDFIAISGRHGVFSLSQYQALYWTSCAASRTARTILS